MASLGIPLLPWHSSKKGDAQRAARVASASPIAVGALHPGDRFETLHTNRLGKVVSLPNGEVEVEEGEEGEEVEVGVLVKLYVPGEGWEEKVLAMTCLVKWRE